MSLVSVAPFIYPSWYPVGGHGGQGRQLDAAEEHAASVIKIPYTGTLKKVGWRITGISSPVMTVKVSVETVADVVGVPVATSNGGKTLYATGAESADITSFSAGVRFDAINGTSGISVTVGDLVAVSFRCTAYTSGSVSVGQDTGAALFPFPSSGQYVPYDYMYLGGSSTATSRVPAILLEYDTAGFVLGQGFASPTPAATSDAWVSTSNPNTRGMKFSIPFGCKLNGVWICGLDSDQDYSVILYDSNEYSVFSGFPVSVSGNKRSSNLSSGVVFIEFPAQPTLLANTYYRIVLLPSTTTPNLTSQYITPTGDGDFAGITAMPGGADFVYTTFNGTPDSGSHTWTDDATKRPNMLLSVSAIDIPAGGSGIPRSRQLLG